MRSFTPYHLPALILALLGVSALLLGGWGAYTAFPDSPKYHYSAVETDDVPSDSEVIQFTDLSETGQNVFLKALGQRYETNQEASEIDIGSDYTGKNYVDYQNQTYLFIGGTNYSGWWKLGLIIFACVGLVGLTAMSLGIWFVKSNQFKRPTAALSGILAIALLRLLTVSQIIEPPRRGYDPTIVLFVMILISVLIWYLLSGVEQYWDMSFSQRMEQ